MTLSGVTVGLLVSRWREVTRSRRNEVRARARGAQEAGRGHYPLFWLLHGAWFLSLWREGRQQHKVNLIFLPILALLGFARFAMIRRAGDTWSARILPVPDEVKRDPARYRRLRLASYGIAAVEIAVAPLAVNARRTAGVFTLLNLLLLLFFRLPAERRAIKDLAGE